MVRPFHHYKEFSKVGMIKPINNFISLIMKSSNYDGKGNWGTLVLRIGDKDGGSETILEHEDIDRLIEELKNAKQILAE